MAVHSVVMPLDVRDAIAKVKVQDLGRIVGVNFELHLFVSTPLELFLTRGNQFRRQPLTAVFLADVDGLDVAPTAFFGSQQESGDLAVNLTDPYVVLGERE